jgi:hypothetical protein
MNKSKIFVKNNIEKIIDKNLKIWYNKIYELYR